MNVVLRNLSFAPDDVLVYFGTVYGAVEKTITSLTETTPVTAHKITYDFPISHETLVQKFRTAIADIRAEGKNAKIAVFDTVVSSPGFRFPFEDLVRTCREEDVLSLVDGAHGVGMIPLDLGMLRPDFFTSNCHKYVLSFPITLYIYKLPRRDKKQLLTMTKMALHPPQQRPPLRLPPKPTPDPHDPPHILGLHPGLVMDTVVNNAAHAPGYLQSSLRAAVRVRRYGGRRAVSVCACGVGVPGEGVWWRGEGVGVFGGVGGGGRGCCC